jgi:hypothetical protein
MKCDSGLKTHRGSVRAMSISYFASVSASLADMKWVTGVALFHRCLIFMGRISAFECVQCFCVLSVVSAPTIYLSYMSCDRGEIWAAVNVPY